MTPHLDSHSTTDPKAVILSAVLTGNRISRDGRNVRGNMHMHQGWETVPNFHFPVHDISTRPVVRGTKRSRDGSLGER